MHLRMLQVRCRARPGGCCCLTVPLMAWMAFSTCALHVYDAKAKPFIRPAGSHRVTHTAVTHTCMHALRATGCMHECTVHSERMPKCATSIGVLQCWGPGHGATQDRVGCG